MASPRLYPGKRTPTIRVETAGPRILMHPMSIARPLIAATLLLLACGSDPDAHLAEVRALQNAGAFARSIDRLNAILELNPELAEANYRLGLALVQTGEPIRAAWPLQKAVEDPAYRVPAGALLASLYYQTQNFDEAVRAADIVLAFEPEHTEALQTRGSAHRAARRSEEALADAQQLVKLAPSDYHAQVLYALALADSGRLDEAQLAHARVRQQGSESDDSAVRQRSCISPAIFAHEFQKDHERARSLYEECAAQAPTDLVVLDTMVRFFDAVDEPERATEIFAAAAQQAPDDLPLVQAFANRLAVTGETEAAEARLLAATEHFASAPAWAGLATFYRTAGRHEDALRAIEKTIELQSVVSPALRFTQADVLIDLGELERAKKIADSLDHDTYAHLIRGRVLLLTGEPAGALAEFEKGLRAWPNNPGARFLAGLAARDLGDDERALSELREAVRAGNAETDAALELARLHYQRGEVEQAARFAAVARSGRSGPTQSEAHVIGARALSGLRRYDAAMREIERLAHHGHAEIALRERARLERERGNAPEAARLIEASGHDLSDPAHVALLAELVEALSLSGRADEALAHSDDALRRSPDAAALHEIRGLSLLRGGQTPEAKRAFERALESDGNRVVALAGLASARHAAGNTPRAIELLDRAATLAPGDTSHAYAAAQLVSGQGEIEEAERRLRAVVARSPGLVGANNDLAWLLAEQQKDLDFALECIEAARRRSDAPEILDTAGWVHFQRGEFRQAIGTLERAVEARPDSKSMRFRLARALEQAGEVDRARKALELVLAGEGFPEAHAARQALARLEALPAP